MKAALQTRRIVVALALSVGLNILLGALSVVSGAETNEHSLLSKIIEILGAPAGLIAWPFAAHGHDLAEAVIMTASLIFAYALVAWFVLAWLARRRRQRCAPTPSQRPPHAV